MDDVFIVSVDRTIVGVFETSTTIEQIQKYGEFWKNRLNGISWSYDAWIVNKADSIEGKIDGH